MLEIKTESDAHDHPQEFFVNPKTGQHFLIRDGIPIFLKEGEVSGSNKKYQTLYDRFAPFYDFSAGMFSRWKGMSVETRLREYLDVLEIAAERLVLSVVQEAAIVIREGRHNTGFQATPFRCAPQST